VNIQPPDGIMLEKALAEKFRELLDSVPELKVGPVERNPAPYDRAFDILAVATLPGAVTVEFWIECKSDPRPARFPYVNIENSSNTKGKETIRVPVFAAPYISPNMGQVCFDHNWSWFDLAGNYNISVPGVPFRLQRSGQAPVHETPRPKANLGTAEASRVVRALLAPSNAGVRWTQRGMAAHFGQQTPPVNQPSLSLVNKVVQHLRDEAFVETYRDGGFQLRKPLELLAAWRDAYRFDRHRLRTYFSLKQGAELRKALLPLKDSAKGQVAFASFSAAELQAPHVRQPRQWLYVGAEFEEDFRAAAEAKVVDSLGYNLAVLIPADDGVFYLLDDKDGRLACTNPVQTYVDLSQSKTRGEEAAEALLEQNLKPAWKKGGLL
jgi:hypothetical protein